MRRGEACLNCDYWTPPEDEHERIGRCERFPPQAVTLPQDGKMRPAFVWPQTRDWEWCGEWRKAKTGGLPPEDTRH
jgi:hypothetical protein